MRWLLITVGGSHQPIVTSIKTLEPDRVVFICSNDTNAKGSYVMVEADGNVCTEPPPSPQVPTNLPEAVNPKHWRLTYCGPPNLPSIPKLTNLPEGKYEVVRVDPDDPSDCFVKILHRLREIYQSDATAEVYADYTGGTKSMTAGLFAAALEDCRVKIRLVTGPRSDLHKITVGECLLPAKVAAIQSARVRDKIDLLISRYYYAAASQVLQSSLVDLCEEPADIKLLNALKAFDAWDRFDYANAYNLLTKALRGQLASKYAPVLSRLQSVPGGVCSDSSGYLLVKDLLANAARRAEQGRYEDAIARHYRAVELTAQIWLSTGHNIQTSNVTYDAIPDSLPWKSDAKDSGSLKVGLLRAWELAAAVDNGNKISQLWAKWQERVLSAISRRNEGLMAHGMTPASEGSYTQDVSDGMAAFVSEALRVIGVGDPSIPEFPRSVSEIELGL